jgi:hypothetical protein
MWPYLQVLVPLCAVGLAGTLCIGVVSFILGHSKFRHKLMVSMPNKSTPDYLFEKANQCFRRARTDSIARVELEALGNEFMVEAIDLDIKLQNLAKGNYTASSPARG